MLPAAAVQQQSDCPKVRRRPRNLKIVAVRHPAEVTTSQSPVSDPRNAAVKVYVNRQRERRVRRGSAYLRRCVIVFMVSLGFVLSSRQYSTPYYVAWVSVYLSFFLMLPSVLPTDSTKIKIMLFATSWNMACGALVASRYASVKRKERPFCETSVCVWNTYFWLAHSTACTFFAVAACHAALRLAPAKGLHRFWRWCGVYFTIVALVGATDLSFAWHAGKYSQPQFRAAGLWNLVLAMEQLAIGRLCLHNRFKLWTWRYAASIAQITVRGDDRGLSFSAVTTFLFRQRSRGERRPLFTEQQRAAPVTRCGFGTAGGVAGGVAARANNNTCVPVGRRLPPSVHREELAPGLKSPPSAPDQPPRSSPTFSSANHVRLIEPPSPIDLLSAS